MLLPCAAQQRLEKVRHTRRLLSEHDNTHARLCATAASFVQVRSYLLVKQNRECLPISKKFIKPDL